ncbi:D-alanyl-D-alanine carboxypeptidase/D-alanyl-D-alanine-endopeptidase [Reticulibacter mediterranei]|uniref:D-alanyl-D-alanine carboxypeptidase/D-alanyl-D-alanine-endopeptidase n=1 Tax=Reticulibacter mediterranei TaxID=2778369 RepID=A0A8J3IZ74_9CHLR|nr:D-alanyl-D-alanine carboxypeptidase/D-alanyl-D-alanine-endopeptidase [Reticulibacter mediterranei]GHO99480.1 D-alanyl-D-alanine carboxypeptidase/D-alanyl-D-alanine-endopeptidase [Reticulibacter mediterranei]
MCYQKQWSSALFSLVVFLVAFLAVTPIDSQITYQSGGLDPRITKIMTSSEYQHGEWGLLEINPTTGRAVHALGSNTRVFVQGSTTKLFSVSAALNSLGFDHRFTTPIYATGNTTQGVLTGNLVLVAQGDLTMGGRTKADGTVDFTNIDHTYADALPGATLTPENPLAGLDQLAQQVRKSGISRVDGDVIIDTRIFQLDQDLDPLPNPIIINDNVIDVVIKPSSIGEKPEAVTWRPQVAPYHLDMQAKTVSAGQPTTLQAQTFPDGRILLSGNIASDAGQVVRAAPILDPAAFARTALIEALKRAGVSVSANASGPNPTAKLPANGSNQGNTRVAAFVSPPFQEYTKLILKVSHNLGANLLICLMAVKTGSKDCNAGFLAIAAFLNQAHVDRKQVAMADGRGGNPVDRFTLQAANDLLRYWLGRPESAKFRQMQPILGEAGGLATICTNCPAKGKVFAKPGTVANPDLLNSPRFALDEALAGYLEVKPNQFYVFDLVINSALPQDITGVLKIYNDLGNIAALLQEEAAQQP